MESQRKGKEMNGNEWNAVPGPAFHARNVPSSCSPPVAILYFDPGSSTQARARRSPSMLDANAIIRLLLDAYCMLIA